MFFPGFAVDQYVVEEHQNKVPKVSAKYIIHKSLESRGSIAQTEWHDQEFKMTVVSSECRFFNVVWMHAYLMISLSQIQFGEVFGSFQFVEEFINNWDGEFIF